MPILDKCSKCGREGGYARKDSDKMCYRCTRGKTVPEEDEEDEDEDEEDEDEDEEDEEE